LSRHATAAATGLAIRLTAATIWLVAGAAKLVDLTHFHAQVDQYKLLPHALEAPLAYTLPFLELLVSLYLALGLFTRVAAGVGCALMVVFLIAQTQAWAPWTVARLRLLRHAHPRAGRSPDDSP